VVLKEQICSPVLWTDSVRRLLDMGCTLFIEAGPGQVLRGLVRRIARDAPVAGLEKPEDLENILERLKG